MKLLPKFLGGMVGSALGDAIGELAFRYPEKERLSTHVAEVDTLVYTDDTAMAIALAESLIATGDVDAKHLGDCFRVHFEREPWRGYGPGPPAIFARVVDGSISYEEAARELYGGAGSLGNGAAMRIVPLGLLFHASNGLYSKAETTASVTHAHALGIDGAAIQAAAKTGAGWRADRAQGSARNSHTQPGIERCSTRVDAVRSVLFFAPPAGLPRVYLLRHTARRRPRYHGRHGRCPERCFFGY
jgi:ADP-ribosylglycohydrolase